MPDKCQMSLSHRRASHADPISRMFLLWRDSPDTPAFSGSFITLSLLGHRNRAKELGIYTAQAETGGSLPVWVETPAPTELHRACRNCGRSGQRPPGFEGGMLIHQFSCSPATSGGQRRACLVRSLWSQGYLGSTCCTCCCSLLPGLPYHLLSSYSQVQQLLGYQRDAV